MNFFLDENFPRPALTQLQSAGHTAVHALEIFPPGTADDHLFAHAQQQRAVFVTTDRDFFHTVPWSFAQHPGAMVITHILAYDSAGNESTEFRTGGT